MHAQCNICSFTALDEKQWNEHTSSTRHKLNDFIYYEGVKAGQYQADAKLRQALTEANMLYNTVEGFNLELTERVAQDELAFGFMKEANTRLTEDVARLTSELAQCKHALDDEGEDACTCSHSLDSHTKSGVHPCGECECLMFWAKAAK